MDTPMPEQNTLKRSFTEMNDDVSDSNTQSPHSLSVSVSTSNDFTPRSYQLKIFEVAKQRNTIALLETGTGKTMIAVMLIREICEAIKSTGLKRLVIFLAPTVHLVIQQYEVIKAHTRFRVDEYHGAKGVDEWTLERWQKEVEDHDVVVMTPQILLDALRKAFLNLEMVSLLILDECHRASGNHPYSKIMKEYYHKTQDKPKVFGMTASPITRKGISTVADCDSQMSDLESVLDSQVYTIEDRSEMDVYVPSARENCRFYDPAWFCTSELKAKIDASLSKFDASVVDLRKLDKSSFKDMDDKLKTMRKRLYKDHAKILYCLDDLGLMCAYEAIKVRLDKPPKAVETHGEKLYQCKDFLEEVQCVIGESLSQGGKCFFGAEFDYEKAVKLGYVSPKLHELLQFFLSFGPSTEIICLIFVERIITAKVIERFIKRVASLAHFTVSYLTGTGTSADALAPKLQKETLESFRMGKVNLLFATDVVEEGIHVPSCSCVIRFDLPRTVRSYIQSRGRARQDNSTFITMVERGNEKQRNQLFDLIRSERSMKGSTMIRDPATWIPKTCKKGESKAYIVDVTGASVTADSSVSLLYKYCEKLPGDRYYTPIPSLEVDSVEGSYCCKIKLPPNAAFHTLVGPACKNQQLAKQFACLEACKKLHELGALDDHLQPLVEKPSEDHLIVKTKETKETSARAGSTKRKELHGTTSVRALSGSWGHKLDGATFHAYKFEFSSEVAIDAYSGFLLLIESKLDNDVGNIELDLYLVRKKVKASISLCGEVHLNNEEIKRAKSFQEFLSNGLFGRLLTRSKGSGKPRQFLLNEETQSLWKQSNMYLLLPIDTLNDSIDKSWAINWTAVNSSSTLIEFLKKNSFLHTENCRSEKSCGVGSYDTDGNAANTIYFANTSVDVNKLKYTVVLAVHTLRIYTVLEVVSDTSAESPFEATGHSSYKEYFSKKYGITLLHPGQPLLCLKQSHKPHNVVVNFNDEGVKKPQQRAYMPPELLVPIGIPFSVLKSFYLLPSVMHRLETLMLASQLRQEIDAPNVNIPCSLILEAITTLRCRESFSMERLELLGDSVLKYTVGCYLFLKYPKKHEGQLSSQRAWAVCNSMLHKLGIGRNLQGYIRDGAFEPRRWVAPGHRTEFPVPCKCGVDTQEVPIDAKFQTINPPMKAGKSCDLGHRWMCSKTISDCVEAVIGAYHASGGLNAAVHVMKWFGMDIEFDSSLIVEAINSASLRLYTPKEIVINSLESKLEYTFIVKGLLLEAITHASMQEQGVDYCYQRLEFLGDAALDILITWHLYQSHTDVDPGLLTDLRSASVNNENFAQVAVRRDFYKHLQHCSTLLSSQITEYVKFVEESDDTDKYAEGPKGPKVLGDLFESIAGAMLIDTKLNLDELWRIFKPLLSPIVTPEKLELPPLRELFELCDSLGYFIKDDSTRDEDMTHAKLTLQLNDVLLIGEGEDRSRKVARGIAASQILKQLEKRGISRNGSNGKKEIADQEVESLTEKLSNEGFDDSTCPETLMDTESQPSSLEHAPVVIEPISMKKGGPRTALFQLCKKQQWQMPTFESMEQKLSSPAEFGEGTDKRLALLCFESKVALNIPGTGIIECNGDAKPDKKSSFDSASLAMLYELEKQGQIHIGGNSCLTYSRRSTCPKLQNTPTGGEHVTTADDTSI